LFFLYYFFGYSSCDELSWLLSAFGRISVSVSYRVIITVIIIINHHHHHHQLLQRTSRTFYHNEVQVYGIGSVCVSLVLIFKNNNKKQQ